MNFIKQLPIAAAAIGLILVLSQSAFKRDQYQLYPFSNGTYQSTPLDPAMRNKPGGWNCVAGSGVCIAEFSIPPSATHQTPDGTVYPGKFILLP